jgi:hypothetical protein
METIYRFTDPLANFKLRVRLRRISTDRIINLSSNDQSTQNEDYDELVVKWQEKYHSQFERELLATNDQRNGQNGRLYTYVNEDRYQDRESRRARSGPNQYMFVMADLKRSESANDYDEHMLCSIAVSCLLPLWDICVCVCVC